MFSMLIGATLIDKREIALIKITIVLLSRGSIHHHLNVVYNGATVLQCFRIRIQYGENETLLQK